MGNSKKVLLIGWDAADWKVISPLMDAGKLPTIQRLVEQGTMGNMATLSPVLSPMLWTSIATGKRPYKHGIYGFTEPTANGKSVRPMTNTSRRCKAVWNILNQNDKQSIVVGWWPSHPAEPINGVMVSDFFHKVPHSPGVRRKRLPNCIHPDEISEELEQFWVSPEEFGPDFILPFVPNAADVDQESDSRLSSCLRILAECSTVHSTATHLLETEPWDFAAIYYDAIDHFSHVFMRYHPPKQDRVSQADFELYQNAVTTAYIYHDMMLKRLCELAGEDTTIMLISDHGFHPDHLRPRNIPTEPAGPALEHRDYGVFLMHGPGIRKDHLSHGQSLLDVAPTILSLFDLPIGSDMDGHVLTDVFEEPPAVREIESWETVEGADGQHEKGVEEDESDSQEALEQLIALGYIDRPDDNATKAVADCQRELDYNLARAYMDADMHGTAIPLLLELYRNYPLEFRFGIQLANCLKAMNRTQNLEQLVVDLNGRWRIAAMEARKRIRDVARISKVRRKDWLALKKIDEENRSDPQRPPRLAKRTAAGKPQLFNPGELALIRRLRAIAKGNPRTLDFLEATIAMSRGEFERALELLKSTKESGSNSPHFHYHLGNAYLELGANEEARIAYRDSLKLDEYYPNSMIGLCRLCLKTGHDSKALEHATRATGLKFYLPAAHYYLGLARLRNDDVSGAIDSLNTAVSQNPNFPEAHESLAEIYSTRQPDEALAQYHNELASSLRDANAQESDGERPLDLPEVNSEDIADQFPDIASIESDKQKLLPCLAQGPTQVEADAERANITVVSGLPRSGTSAMMRMLAAGGLTPFTDNHRQPDPSNPGGYYEADIVKQLAQNNRWLPDADGQVVKVVAPLVPFLPQNCNYRIVFMDRNINEVVKSQTAMLASLDTEGADLTEEKLKEVMTQQFGYADRLCKAHSIPMLVVKFSDLFDSASDVAKRLKEFLKVELDSDAMTAVIDKKLYRQRDS